MQSQKKGGLRYHPEYFAVERETGFEPATSTLARLHSTAELFPLNREGYLIETTLKVKGKIPKQTLDVTSDNIYYVNLKKGCFRDESGGL
jgi:hypothetical protein